MKGNDKGSIKKDSANASNGQGAKKVPENYSCPAAPIGVIYSSADPQRTSSGGFTHSKTQTEYDHKDAGPTSPTAKSDIPNK